MQVQEAQSFQKKLGPRKAPPRQIKITLPKIKDKEKILKGGRGKENIPNLAEEIDFQEV